MNEEYKANDLTDSELDELLIERDCNILQRKEEDRNEKFNRRQFEEFCSEYGYDMEKKTTQKLVDKYCNKFNFR